MYHELSCYSRTDTEDSVREAIFNAINQKFNGVSMLPYFLQSMQDFLVEGMDVACAIDYPYGTSDASVRSHAVLAAIRKGANTIDLIANSNLLCSKKHLKFFDEIEAMLRITTENNVTLRIILEYRLFNPKEMVNLCNGLREVKIEYIIPSTGAFVDSWDDNLLISTELTKKCKIKVITNGNIWKKSQYDSIIKAKIFGIRLSSNSAMKSVFLNNT